jgi:hypothetical protein
VQELFPRSLLVVGTAALHHRAEVRARVPLTVVKGDPDTGQICTSYVERQNLTMRHAHEPDSGDGRRVADHPWALREIAALLD